MAKTVASLDKTPDPLAQSVWFSSATAGLIAALEAVDAKGKWVAVPPNICPNIIAAIFSAGCKPWFVDIEPERQGINPDHLEEVIGEVGAVIAVHAYGTPCKIDSIMQVASMHGVPVIEDCAQADGAVIAGQEVGQFCDIAVFSFGKGKIVEVEGGGGLVIVRNPKWLEAMKDLIAPWEQSADSIAGDDLGNMYRFLYNRFYPGRTASTRESFLAMVNTLAPSFRTLCRQERITGLIAARSRRESLVLARRQKYHAYIKQLVGAEHIAPIPLQDGAAPWRFNAVVHADRRDVVFRKLLASNVKASTWYPSMTEFLPEHAFRSTDLLVARRFGQTLLNLWVDETTDTQDIILNCARLKQDLSSPGT